jgi:hypothetical protein
MTAFALQHAYAHVRALSSPKQRGASGGTHKRLYWTVKIQCGGGASPQSNERVPVRRASPAQNLHSPLCDSRPVAGKSTLAGTVFRLQVLQEARAVCSDTSAWGATHPPTHPPTRTCARCVVAFLVALTAQAQTMHPREGTTHYPRAPQPIVRCARLECGRDCLVSAGCAAGAAAQSCWLMMMRVDRVRVKPLLNVQQSPKTDPSSMPQVAASGIQKRRQAYQRHLLARSRP